MRIISGRYKRLNLDTLDGDNTRPTKDMVREALFDSLWVNEDESFLDAFAGSGAVGIEAISRGLEDVVFNDLSKDACRVIRSNLKKIKADKKLYNLDYITLFNTLKRDFDYIFLDPPYALDDYDNIFNLIDTNNLLKQKGIIIFEVRNDSKIKDSYLSYKLYKERKYGISKLMYYKKEA
ncbi:MAG: 16S rRNA (guanine(966)-N(2))-methyltransferase RsmD [Erysipelotrichaceae bacterium]